MSNVFRKIALEKLSSPEQLDKLVTVTHPGGWLALIGIGLVLLFTLAWSIFGSIPTTVVGGGILIKTGGVVSVVAPVQGQIESVYVREGDTVNKGQIVARIAQPALLDEIRLDRLALEEERARAARFTSQEKSQLQLDVDNLEKERENVRLSLRGNEERTKWLAEKVAVQEQLLEEGLITRQTLIDTQTSLEKQQLAVETDRADLGKVQARLQELLGRNDASLADFEKNISKLERDLELKTRRLEFSSRVVSAYTGVVVELQSYQSQVISPGETLLSLERTGDDIQDLQALIYMPPDQGKQIRRGMVMHITPRTVKREEYGTMLGMVTEVAEFPSTQSGMMRYLKNPKLADQFSKKAAPIAVFADPIPDAETHSGFRWSSPKGPPAHIYSGTLCQGAVEVRSQRPISLVIPYLRKTMGLD